MREGPRDAGVRLRSDWNKIKILSKRGRVPFAPMEMNNWVSTVANYH